MKFRLIFEGEIPPRPQTKAPEIHAIRLKLAPQLEKLWSYPPLGADTQKWLRHPEEANGNYALLERRGKAVFAPLVSTRNDLLCELDVVFLRQQAAGQLIGEGGDIDNRVKTLLDALSVPPPAQAELFSDADASTKLFCLLQDDSLVTRVSVETDRLLRQTQNRHDLVVIVQMSVRASRVTYGNLGLMG